MGMFEYVEIRERVIETVKKNAEYDTDKVSEESNLAIDLGINSIKKVNLLVDIEDAFGIDLDTDNLQPEDFTTVGQVINYVEDIVSNGLVTYAKDTVSTSDDSIPQSEEKEYYPLTSVQKRLFTLCEIENIFNMPFAVLIEGSLDVGRIESAFRQFIKRHEVFRTSFEYRDGNPVQIVHKAIDDFHIENVEASESELDSFLNRFIRKFDLAKAPLLRVMLVKLSVNKHLLVIDIHHIISDGKSLGIITRELMSSYLGMELPEVKLQYRDFAEWQRIQFEPGKISKQERYWRDIFKDGIPRLKIPLDFERPEKPIFEVRDVTSSISGETVGKINEFVQKWSITLNTLFFTVYSILLSKYSNQEDVVVGSIVEGRNHPELVEHIGYYAYTIPVRLKIKGDDKVSVIFEMVKKALTDAYKHMDYPFEKLTEGAGRIITKDPLLDTLMNFINEGSFDFQIEGLKIANYDVKRRITDMDFNLDIKNTPLEMTFVLRYNTSLFREETMVNFMNCFKNMVEEIIKNPVRKISDIKL
ncbi:MAG: condensation domain-containing protein [Clostridia bacterium]|nr:condensation domain-containing protein [Clostridia bacterium]